MALVAESHFSKSRWLVLNTNDDAKQSRERVLLASEEILPTVRTMQNGGPMMGGQHGTTMGGHMMDGQHGTRMNGNDGHMMDEENGSMIGESQGRSTPPKNAIKVTPQLSKKGAVQMLAFVATRDIDQYLCTVHPTTMVGKVTVKNDHSGNGDHGHGEGSGNSGGS
jgi:hypothetical protein